MKSFGKWIVKRRVFVLIFSLVLLIPSLMGILGTRINYDILTYLPQSMDTVRGQDILLEDFGKGAFSLVMVEGMPEREAARLKKDLETVEHVDSVIWYDSLFDEAVPMEMLPEKYYDIFNQGDTTLMAVFFDTSTSSDETIEAIGEVREVAGETCFVSGMSALVTDLKGLCEREEPVYVGLAVLLAVIVLAVFMDSLLLPILFLVSIGIAIVYNLGTNYFFGEISYITKALASVLQLGVTMDYSIFLWNSYKEEKLRNGGDGESAMAEAIAGTITSVVGSSVTTIAGFIALCFMTFTLGRDLGLVMAKGVVFGVVGCVTTLPALILLFDRLITKTSHKVLMPDIHGLASGLMRHFRWGLAIFLILLVPAFYGYVKAPLYYDFTGVMPKDMECIIANTKLKEEFDVSSTHMALVDSGLSGKEATAMLAEMERVDGVRMALGLNSLIGSDIPEEILPDSVREILKTERYQLILISSEYTVSTDEVNEQIDRLNRILKAYDPEGMLIGEAPCTKDLIGVTDRDFKVVDAVSILSIFVIIALVLKSASLPVILVAVIEFAVFVNLGLPYYTDTELPFIAPICLSTIQLGATVDYAILMTTRYKQERRRGKEKEEAIQIALETSIPSIVVSALSFFAATFGVAVYSNIDMIQSLCSLMARGALVSMVSVIGIMPGMYRVFDGLICRTSRGFGKKEKKEENHYVAI
ncbi:MAG: MMPL family transporter [Lachnospiraceae bacterium]|nr:MMPL family transporter [Lachnospiraceae bacterium]